MVLRDLPSPDTSIVKVSISCDSAQMDMAYILSRELEADFVFAPSGAKWIDVMQRGVNKATGINQVLAAHGVAAENVMAFGDSMNDYEILRMVGHSCAMGNGRWAVKQVSKRIIGKNTEQAVQQISGNRSSSLSIPNNSNRYSKKTFAYHVTLSDNKRQKTIR